MDMSGPISPEPVLFSSFSGFVSVRDAATFGITLGSLFQALRIKHWASLANNFGQYIQSPLHHPHFLGARRTLTAKFHVRKNAPVVEVTYKQRYCPFAEPDNVEDVW